MKLNAQSNKRRRRRRREEGGMFMIKRNYVKMKDERNWNNKFESTEREREREREQTEATQPQMAAINTWCNNAPPAISQQSSRSPLSLSHSLPSTLFSHRHGNAIIKMQTHRNTIIITIYSQATTFHLS